MRERRAAGRVAVATLRLFLSDENRPLTPSHCSILSAKGVNTLQNDVLASEGTKIVHEIPEVTEIRKIQDVPIKKIPDKNLSQK